MRQMQLSCLIEVCGRLEIGGFSSVATGEFFCKRDGQMGFDAGKWQGKVHFDGSQVVELDTQGRFQMVLTYRKKVLTLRAKARPMLRDPDQTVEEFLLIKLGEFQLLPWLPEDTSIGSPGWLKAMQERRRQQRLAEQQDVDCVLANYD